MVKVLSNHSKTLKIGPTLHLSLMLVLFVQGLLQFKQSDDEQVFTIFRVQNVKFLKLILSEINNFRPIIFL